MEQETLFTASKWDILTALQDGSRSPVELARILNTSAANISQQLRLLEMAGLVESKRISNREKGLPRILYSLSGNHSYLIAATKEFVDKKLVQLTERNKVTLRIWFLDNPVLHYYIEKAFWSIDEHLNDIEALLLDQTKEGINIAVISEKNLSKKIQNLKLKNPDGIEKEIKFSFLSKKQAIQNLQKFYVLYDIEGMMTKGENSE